MSRLPWTIFTTGCTRKTAIVSRRRMPARRIQPAANYITWNTVQIGIEDGAVRWVAAKGRGMFDEAGRCKRVIGTAIDITERRLAQEEKLTREKEDAELREQFIAVLGHDLRNPLASVAAGTRALARRPEQAADSRPANRAKHFAHV